MLFVTLFGTWTLPLLCGVALVARIIYNKYGYGISGIPGPFLASWTDLWRFFTVWGGHAERVHIDLHAKLGSMVRLGPNCVSVSEPEAIKVIYGLASGYVKVQEI